MKYKKRILRLQARIKAYESMGSRDQAANTKPGSLNK